MPSGSPQRAIGIASRAPVPGNVKSRLAQELGQEAAAQLYSAFLRDVLVSSAAIPDTLVAVFHPVGDDSQRILDLCPPGVRVMPERGAGYSEVLPAALLELLAVAPVAALIGADSPGLPNETIRAGFSAVETGEYDVAICPASDGGYCFLVVNDNYPGLFATIDWGTDRVFAQMTARADTLGLRCAVLPAWYDIDRAADLERLANDLAGNVEIQAATTRSTLQRLRDSGLPLPTGQNPWQVSQHRSIHRTPWRSLVSDVLTTHAGEEIDYAYLETEQAVWVVPVMPDGRILLVRQYRHPIGEIILEVPAGSGNDPTATARRELKEEIGGVAGEFIHIATFFPASAHLTHQGHVFVALDVQIGRPDAELTELLSVFSVPFELALDMARRGEIADSQSALAILAAEPVIRAALQLPDQGTQSE
ncbi:hypothetical protein BH23CHL2_BH23CHL2_24800 [soil metagenome]